MAGLPRIPIGVKKAIIDAQNLFYLNGRVGRPIARER